MDCLLCGAGRPEFLCKALLYPGAEREVHRCPSCGGAYYWPVPSLEEVARCYPHAYFRDFFKQYWKDLYKGRLLAEDLGAWRPEGTLLDVGCALGTFLAGVRDASKRRVLGLEYSPAAAKAGKALNGVDIAVGGLPSAPWAEGSVDLVNINNVLEHERDPAAALSAAARLLSPGGRLRLCVPNGPVDLRATLDLWRRLERPVVTRHGGHLFFMTRRSLETLFARAGLRLASLRNFHFQLGAKARGLKPGAYRPFLRPPAPPPPDDSAGMPLDELRRLVPPQPSWTAYKLKARWRRLWRLPDSEFGYDFEAWAEKA
ncbi:MAG: methyltransferase domain-containing protein [Elusimicrobia bacterium]|nr:methyltransferase domain-containing protein [Elusimicrobiota bacterium]